jgi:membrane protein DedA with SNARE-associated domain
VHDLLNFTLGFSGIMPYVVIFVILLACGLGLPIPEDITLFVAGMLAYYGMVNIWAMIFICMAGVLIGDSSIFLLGAKYGPEITKKPFFSKFLTPERIEMVKTKLHDHGNKVIFVSRFMPGVRAPTFFCAGTLHLPLKIFLLYDGLAALISVPGIVWVVYHFGYLADDLFTAITDVEHVIVFGIIAAIAFGVGKWYYHHKKSSQA